MQIIKTFHFYAAHRNEEIGGKCGTIHGHRYGISVTIEEPKNGSITILFEEIEKKIEPIIKQMDHTLLLNAKDPAKKALLESGACCRIYEVPFVTSAENMAKHLLEKIRETGLNAIKLALQETDSSTVTVKI